jgi:indolepyruvate ferredoxin oxidoreductase beta subunit
MLGAISGCGRLPLTQDQFEAAIREDGKSIESNLRGFRAGYEAARANLQPARLPDKKKNAAATPALVEHEVARTFPAVAQATGLEGVRRLIRYQNVAYGRLYLDRLRPIVEAADVIGAQGKLLNHHRRERDGPGGFAAELDAHRGGQRHRPSR